MARRLRGWVPGSCYHITHRCHEKNFLLKFAKYRDLYLDYLYDAVRKYRMHVLDYAVTSNHVHLLVYVVKGPEVSKAIQHAHGRIAQHYNILKNREGSFWKDRFHATRIETGKHMGRCLFYIDMNMVRAKVVESPFAWKHNGCNEFFNENKRKEIIDFKRLLKCLCVDDIADFKRWYMKTLKAKLKEADHARETFWTEASAVGSYEWLEKCAANLKMKRFKIKAIDELNDEIYFLRGKS